jgi:cytochrome P450
MIKMNTKFENKEGIVFIDDYAQAKAILDNEDFQVPDLLGFLNRLESATEIELKHLKLSVWCSPFFLEGHRQQEIRKLYFKYINNTSLKLWKSFIDDVIESVVSSLPENASFNVVTAVGEKVFTCIARPLLGVFPKDEAIFDEKAMTLQRLVEPMLSIKKLKAVDQDLCELMAQLNGTEKTIRFIDTPTKPLLMALVENETVSIDEAYALVTTLYAAMAPLAQTVVNLIEYVYVNKITDSDELQNIVEQQIQNSVAPNFIHRVVKRTCMIDEMRFSKGDTVLIDIRGAVSKNKGQQNHLSFGHGLHFCLGAALSKMVMKKVIVELTGKIKVVEIISSELDVNNSIATAHKKLIIKKV